MTSTTGETRLNEKNKIDSLGCQDGINLSLGRCGGQVRRPPNRKEQRTVSQILS